MKKFSAQFKKQSDTVRLRASERAELKKDLRTFIAYHPLPNGTAQKKHTIYDIFHIRTPLSVRYLVPGCALLLLTIIPVVAERSDPGDRLYAVKVSVNEELRGTFSRSHFQALEWETERISRRVAEIQKLDREGRLTSERESIAAEALRQHSVTAKDAIERIRQEDEEEAMMAEIALDALFDVYAALLHTDTVSLASAERQQESDSEEESTSTDAAGKRQQIIEALQSGRTSTENQITNQPSYNRLILRIEQEITSSYEILDSVSEVANSEELQSVTRRLEDTTRRVERAIALKSEGNEQEARTLLTETLTSVRKAKAFLTNIEIRNSLDLDTLLPIEYTAEELRLQLEERLAILLARASEIEENAEAITIPADVLEKINESLANSEERWGEISDLITNEEYAEAGELLSTQDILLFDIEKIIEKYRAVDVGRNETASSTANENDRRDSEVATSSTNNTTNQEESATSTNENETDTDRSNQSAEELVNEDDAQE